LPAQTPHHTARTLIRNSYIPFSYTTLTHHPKSCHCHYHYTISTQQYECWGEIGAVNGIMADGKWNRVGRM